MATTREYDGVCARVIDGDTVVLSLTHTFSQEVDFGFYVKDTVSLTKTAEITFRLNGINTPEITGPTKIRGLAAKAALEQLLGQSSLRVVSYKADKYGRWLVDIYLKLAGGGECFINEKLIELGHALPWDGHGIKPV